ncbi:hypothetical protein [Halorubrum amylolyticum]|uniref:hypothetical protein n=1 Tax=Halorubrum amylolyticum TaxID=2508724 RepID=UPI001008E37F|nr:hypothetical protein [Halorubrum amylolyticum]
MKRRSVICQLAVGCAAVSAGCGRFVQQNEHRLWFLSITNGSSRGVNVSISISRSGEDVFSQTYSDIVSFQETGQDGTSHAERENTRLIEGEWSPEPGNYTLEYTYRDEEERLDVAAIEDFETDHIGVEMTFLGGAQGPPRATFNLVEFESEEEARDALVSIR